MLVRLLPATSVISYICLLLCMFCSFLKYCSVSILCVTMLSCFFFSELRLGIFFVCVYILPLAVRVDVNICQSYLLVGLHILFSRRRGFLCISVESIILTTNRSMNSELSHFFHSTQMM